LPLLCLIPREDSALVMQFTEVSFGSEIEALELAAEEGAGEAKREEKVEVLLIVLFREGRTSDNYPKIR